MINSIKLKSVLLLIFSSVLVFDIKAQNCQTTLLDDFETNRLVTKYTAFANGTLVENQANPLVGGINVSATCAKFIPNAPNYVVAKVILTLDAIKNANLFKNGVLTFQMDFYGSPGGEVKAYLCKKGANHASLTDGKHTMMQGATNASTSAWQKYSFTAALYEVLDNTVFADSIAEIELQFPVNVDPVYFDNISYVATYKSIDNFDTQRNATLKSFQGTFNQALSNGTSNKVNSSSKCATYKKLVTNGNSAIRYSLPASISPARLLTGVDRFGISTYSPAEAAPVRVSLIDTNVTPNAVHSVYEGRGTVYADWNFVTLSLTSQPNPTTANGDIDVIQLEFDAGAVSTTLYRFDDFIAYMYVPPTPTSITGASSPCSGANVYDYSVAGLPNVGYEWLIPGGTTTAGATPNSVKAIFNSPPSYIQTRYTIQGGCASGWFVKSFSGANQPASITAGVSPNSVCEGVSTNLTGSFSGSNSAQWSTSGTGKFVTNLGTTYTPSAVDGDLGVIDLTYTTVGGNCGSKSSTVSLNVLPKPAILDISPDIEICTTATSVTVHAISNAGTKVNWFGYNTSGFAPANPVNNGANVVYTFASIEKTVGNVSQLKVTTDYNYSCGTDSKYINIKFTANACVVTSTQDVQVNNSVKLYPNPSVDGRFVVESEGELVEVVVTNAVGQKEFFYSKEFKTNFKGLVVVTVKTKESVVVNKMMVE